MSVLNSISKIERELTYKRLLIIDGNVQDIFPLNGDFKKISEYLYNSFEEKNLFEEVFIWDRIEGLTKGNINKIELPKPPKEDGNPIEGLDEDIFEQDEQQGQYNDPNDFYPIIYNTIKSGNIKTLFILDYSDYLFPNEQAFGEHDRQNITQLSKSIRDQKISFPLNSNKNSAIILITSNISNIPVSVYKNNPDACIVTLSVPDRDERERFINEIQSHIKLNLNDEMARANFIDATNGFTYKELIQIAQLSQNISNNSVEKLLSIYKYGVKDSPWEKLDTKKVSKIEEILSKRVKGQDEAIRKVKNVVIRAKTGLSGLQHNKEKSKPKGVLFFAGPTGVGKTELAKALAEFLFGDENAFIRFDMSEYNHEHSDQKLIGAPPGYVGYEAGGQLTNLIKEKPFSVILFDEIEKAHPKILDKFLQILEDGRLTDSRGETVYFSESIIIFTSNIGANMINPKMDKNEIHKTIFSAIKEKFEKELNRPELLGRIGYSNIISFNFITDKAISSMIVKAKLKPLINFLEESKKIKLRFKNEDTLIKYILSKVDTSKGGRDILNKIEDILIDPLSIYLFENEDYIFPESELSVLFDESTKKINFDV